MQIMFMNINKVDGTIGMSHHSERNKIQGVR